MGGFAGQATHHLYEATPPTTSRAIQAIGRNMAITFSQGANVVPHFNPVNMPAQGEENVAGSTQPFVHSPILPIEEQPSQESKCIPIKSQKRLY